MCISCFLSVFTFLLCVSCAKDIQPRIALLKGTFAWKRQYWSDAISYYLPMSLDNQIDIQTKNYAMYGLATVYLAQDEYKAAEQKLKMIPRRRDTCCPLH